MRRLIEAEIVPELCQKGGRAIDGDAAILDEVHGELAFTTDSFVVSPLFFPGGDIGCLSVFGTVNDLLVSGAEPRWLSLGLMIEEGFPMDLFKRVISSISSAAQLGSMFGSSPAIQKLSPAAVWTDCSSTRVESVVLRHRLPGPSDLHVGDELIVTGPIGRHGIAVMVAREQIGLTPEPISDCAPLAEPGRTSRQGRIAGRRRIRASSPVRDATRGGVTAVLHEWAEASHHTLTIKESSIPVSDDVRGAAELLGLDPLHVACEGTMLIAVRKGQSDNAIAALKHSTISQQAQRIGEVTQRGISPVTIRRAIGTERPLDEPSGAQLPRIC